MMERNNYELSKERAQRYFLKFDQQDLIEKYGLRYTEEILYVPFLGDEYHIMRKTGEVFQGGRPAVFEEVLSIFDLLCHSGKAPVKSGVWAPVNSLKGKPASAGVKTTMFEQYAGEFDRDKAAFCRACERLGAKRVNMGDIGYEIPVFFEMSVLIKFYEADEEFPAQATVLWEENALQYVFYETTFYIVKAMFEKIRRLMS